MFSTDSALLFNPATTSADEKKSAHTHIRQRLETFRDNAEKDEQQCLEIFTLVSHELSIFLTDNLSLKNRDSAAFHFSNNGTFSAYFFYGIEGSASGLSSVMQIIEEYSHQATPELITAICFLAKQLQAIYRFSQIFCKHTAIKFSQQLAATMVSHYDTVTWIQKTLQEQDILTRVYLPENWNLKSDAWQSSIELARILESEYQDNDTIIKWLENPKYGFFTLSDIYTDTSVTERQQQLNAIETLDDEYTDCIQQFLFYWQENCANVHKILPTIIRMVGEDGKNYAREIQKRLCRARVIANEFSLRIFDDDEFAAYPFLQKGVQLDCFNLKDKQYLLTNLLAQLDFSPDDYEVYFKHMRHVGMLVYQFHIKLGIDVEVLMQEFAQKLSAQQAQSALNKYDFSVVAAGASRFKPIISDDEIALSYLDEVHTQLSKESSLKEMDTLDAVKEEAYANTFFKNGYLFILHVQARSYLLPLQKKVEALQQQFADDYALANELLGVWLEKTVRYLGDEAVINSIVEYNQESANLDILSNDMALYKTVISSVYDRGVLYTEKKYQEELSLPLLKWLPTMEMGAVNGLNYIDKCWREVETNINTFNQQLQDEKNQRATKTNITLIRVDSLEKQTVALLEQIEQEKTETSDNAVVKAALTELYTHLQDTQEKITDYKQDLSEKAVEELELPFMEFPEKFSQHRERIDQLKETYLQIKQQRADITDTSLKAGLRPSALQFVKKWLKKKG